MTQDEMIELAKEAGFGFDDTGRLWLPIEAKLANFADIVLASQAQPTSQDVIDAERYRYLKANVKRIPIGWFAVGFDTAIDAAMKDSK